MAEELVIFPDDFLPSSDRNYPLLIGGFNRTAIENAVRQKVIERFARSRKEQKYLNPQDQCQFRIINLDEFLGREYYVSLKGFLIFDPPLESRSKRAGSVALYHAAHKEMGLLLHSIPANGMTSPHYHKIWTEITFLLTGKAELKTCENRHLLIHQLTEASPVGPVVRQGTTHQIFTSQPSLILIKITGDENWFDKWLTGQEHHFQEFPNSQKLFTK